MQWHNAIVMELCPILGFLDGQPITNEDRQDLPTIGDVAASGTGVRRRSTSQQQALVRKEALKMAAVSFDDIVFEEGGTLK